jgi:hypothetical protein
MNPQHVVAIAATSLGLLLAATPLPAEASAEGPGTPQAAAAHAEFLATLPAPPTGAGTVCVIDSGIDTDTDLGPALTSRSAFDAGTPNDTGAKGDDGTQLPKHGTYVAGVIASQIDGVGTNGIWPAAKVMSRRVFGGPTSGATASAYINAITWCQSDPSLKVVNLSLSGLSATLSERQVLENKIGGLRGAPYFVNVVAAAGNNGVGYAGYPASGLGVFAVGATDGVGVLTPFSNRGTGVDISTFGSATCLSTYGGSHLARGHGTSYAAPLVSAVLDALRSYKPSLTPDQAEALLIDTADTTSAGAVLNAANAFAAAGVITQTQAAATYATVQCRPDPMASSDFSGNVSTASAGAPAEQTATTPTPVVADVAGSTSEQAAGVDVPPPSIKSGEPRAPIVRSVTLHKGMLTVRIIGRRSTEAAIFRVTQRVKTRKGWKAFTQSFSRSASVLRVKASHWTTIRVQLRRPDGSTSPVATAHSHVDLY